MVIQYLPGADGDTHAVENPHDPAATGSPSIHHVSSNFAPRWTSNADSGWHSCASSTPPNPRPPTNWSR